MYGIWKPTNLWSKIMIRHNRLYSLQNKVNWYVRRLRWKMKHKNKKKMSTKNKKNVSLHICSLKFADFVCSSLTDWGFFFLCLAHISSSYVSKRFWHFMFSSYCVCVLFLLLHPNQFQLLLHTLGITFALRVCLDSIDACLGYVATRSLTHSRTQTLRLLHFLYVGSILDTCVCLSLFRPHYSRPYKIINCFETSRADRHICKKGSTYLR